MSLPERWYPLRPHPEQDRLWNDPHRFKLVAAGRGSGKTELAKRRIILALSEPTPGNPEPLYFAAAPTHDQARRVWWEDLKKLCPLDWVSSISESDNSIHTVFGSTLYLTGLDKPQRIEGNQYAGGIVDECCDIRPGAFARSIRPALSSHRGWCWRIGVPKRFGVGAAEFRLAWEQAKNGEAPDSAAYWWPSADILTADEVDAAKQALSAEDYEEQYGAKWIDTQGVLFSGFSPIESVRPCGYDPDEKIYVSCDFNVNPMCWVLAHRYGDRIEVFDEIFIRNTNTAKTLDALHGRYEDHYGGWLFTGDATSRARKTSASQSDYLTIYNDQRFIQAGRAVRIGSSNPSIVDRVAATNRLLCNAAGQRRLHVDPHCTHLIDDLRLRAEVHDANSDLTHSTDALGYLVWTLFPIRPISSHTAGRVMVIPRAPIHA